MGCRTLQVNAFLHSLGVEAGPVAHHALDGTFGGRFSEFEGAWGDAKGARGGPAPWEKAGPGQHLGVDGAHPSAWAEEFAQQEKGRLDAMPGAAWANEFGEVRGKDC